MTNKCLLTLINTKVTDVWSSGWSVQAVKLVPFSRRVKPKYLKSWYTQLPCLTFTA